jgi:hypothetical protein
MLAALQLRRGARPTSPAWTRRCHWTPSSEILREVGLERRPEVLDDETRWRLVEAVERGKARERARGRPFSRRAANARLRKGEHL